MPAEERIAFLEPLAKGLWDGFPVAPGHLLIVPHRHVATWSELHATEQQAVVGAIVKAQEIIRGKHSCDGFNVGFNEGLAGGQTVPHFHLHVIPRVHGDMEDPRGGVRHVIPEKGNYLRAQVTPTPELEAVDAAPRSAAAPIFDTPHARALITGADDALIRHLLPHIDNAQAVDVAVAFVLESGVRLLRPHLQELLDRSGRLRLVTGDYLDATDPDALRRLMDLEGDVHLSVFETKATGFHPKSWIFHMQDQSGVALVGSSNLSETALRTGVEWNLRTHAPDQGGDWETILTGFEMLLAKPEVRPLTHDWIDRYEARRQPALPSNMGVAEIAEPYLVAPQPHPIQQRALAALEETRRAGYSAGMVVLATGLGKTWLSAFDSNRPEFRRILFVAHREEILNQAMETFRRCRPKARLGRYNGDQKDTNADVLFASIQTLGRVTHLRNFRPEHFDYVVVDEFHHAAAATYRKLIDHFSPKFLLGLTATPDRMDGADLLGLCQENLVFQCDAFEGIEAELLSPFSYFGVPDDIDYAQIPWRGTRFDEEALTQAAATQARAQNALEQYRKLGGSRTIAFCVSQRHADFMASFFVEQGLRAVAVHSGARSAPRASSLEALEAGELDVVCAVDMFNEGVDVPNVDTIMMLRPTESSVIWMQQFGRGLRRSEGKDRLRVIDYIGNHRIFLTKARTLLQCSPGDRALALQLEAITRGKISLPPGCEVTYDLEALDILRNLLRPTSRGDAIESFYQDFELRFEARPTAIDVLHAGFNPRSTGHGSWFRFVRDQGGLKPEEDQALTIYGDLLDLIATTPMTRSYKMLVLQALRQEGKLPGLLSIDRLQQRFTELAQHHPAFRADVSARLSDDRAVRRLLEQHPVKAWVKSRSAAGKSYFSYDGGTFRTSAPEAPALQVALGAMIDEVIDWRLAEYLARGAATNEGEQEALVASSKTAPNRPAANAAVLWREYMREEIPPLFGLPFNTGSWNQGFVLQGTNAFLLVTLDKSGLQDDHQYDDGFISADRFRWQSQNRTEQQSKHGQIIRQAVLGYAIHLFVRPAKKRGTKATPFVYCGEVDFERWEGEAPITVDWALRNAVPGHLRRTLRVP
ncbi:DUF3427 domain-containing protein [Allosphingosinicella deserti]|uniref:DUF3427 domain-containing protein n=1 Tax=Allosphingosinicella deserti TaxID=2116704 RepID=A0A2P7QM57_9SPHN|nr:DUF3427 domain-containing protein [Sphingomonas deserti]PSJ39035.1 DUF3427 domain-containing protein [Sphingomonas deserti]